jgi:hypothetical protein
MAFGSMYILIDPRTEEIRYVGWTTKSLLERLQRHKSEKKSSHKANWIASLVQLGLIPRVELIQRVPIDFWEEAERYWIAFFRSRGCPLTNASDGGHGSLHHAVSVTSRLKIGSYHKGKTISAEHRAKVSAAATQRWAQWRAEGRVLPVETRERISASRKGIKMPDGFGEAVGQRLKGKPKSSEHRERIRQALQGKPKSPEQRVKTLKQYMGS